MANVVKAIVYGQEYTLTLNPATGKYEAEVNAPSDSSYQYNEGHYFPVTITATDEAGNITTISDTQGDFKEQLKLYVKEQIKPTIANVSPSSNANIGTSNPIITFDVIDNANGQTTGFAGINPDSIVLTVNDTTISVSSINKESIAGGYRCTYTPTTALKDGNCTITIKVADYDGNTSDVTSIMFNIDTAPPILDVTAPADNNVITNVETFLVTGTTSDVNYSSPVVVTIDVNGIDQGDVIIENGSFSKEIKLTEGINTVTIVSTDLSGKTTTIVRTIALKTKGLVFKTVKIAPNPVSHGNLYTISVTFEE